MQCLTFESFNFCVFLTKMKEKQKRKRLRSYVLFWSVDTCYGNDLWNH